VLQCVAVCCSVLQCVAVCCVAYLAAKEDRPDDVRLHVTQVWCGVLQLVAACCSVLQCVVMRTLLPQRIVWMMFVCV